MQQQISSSTTRKKNGAKSGRLPCSHWLPGTFITLTDALARAVLTYGYEHSAEGRLSNLIELSRKANASGDARFTKRAFRAPHARLHRDANKTSKLGDPVLVLAGNFGW